MASMYRRKNGIWYAKWTEHGRDRRRSLRTRSVQRARAKLVDIEEALEAGRPVGYRADIAVDEFTALYLSHIRAEKRPYTVKGLSHCWDRFLDWAKPITLREVTLDTMKRYKAHLLAKGYAKSTVKSTLLALSSTFSTAIKEMHVLEGDNPVKGVGLPRPDERQPRFLSLDQIDRLLACARQHSPDMYLLVALATYTGMRKNELINTKWAWVDLEQGRILIQGEGRFQTKSGRVRSVPLAAKLKAVLEEHRDGGPDDYILYPTQPEKAGRKNSHTKYRVDFTWAFDTVCKAADLSWVTPHILRHTFASQLAMAGVSLFKIGEWLGHADPKTTKIYAHLAPANGDIDRF